MGVKRQPRKARINIPENSVTTLRACHLLIRLPLSTQFKVRGLGTLVTVYGVQAAGLRPADMAKVDLLIILVEYLDICGILN